VSSLQSERTSCLLQQTLQFSSGGGGCRLLQVDHYDGCKKAVVSD